MFDLIDSEDKVQHIEESAKYAWECFQHGLRVLQPLVLPATWEKASEPTREAFRQFVRLKWEEAT